MLMCGLHASLRSSCETRTDFSGPFCSCSSVSSLPLSCPGFFSLQLAASHVSGSGPSSCLLPLPLSTPLQGSPVLSALGEGVVTIMSCLHGCKTDCARRTCSGKAHLHRVGSPCDAKMRRRLCICRRVDDKDGVSSTRHRGV